MKVFKWILAVVAVLSLVILLYGSIKVAQFENKTPPVSVDMPGVKIEFLDRNLDRDFALRIASISGFSFVISLIGFGALAWIQRNERFKKR